VHASISRLFGALAAILVEWGRSLRRILAPPLRNRGASLPPGECCFPYFEPESVETGSQYEETRFACSLARALTVMRGFLRVCHLDWCYKGMASFRPASLGFRKVGI